MRPMEFEWAGRGNLAYTKILLFRFWGVAERVLVCLPLLPPLHIFGRRRWTTESFRATCFPVEGEGERRKKGKILSTAQVGGGGGKIDMVKMKYTPKI